MEKDLFVSAFRVESFASGDYSSGFCRGRRLLLLWPANPSSCRGAAAAAVVVVAAAAAPALDADVALTGSN